jgi:hypothetical protein
MVDKHRHIVAVDPGDEHVGVAWWELTTGRATEVNADVAAAAIARLIVNAEALVIEAFVLYPHTAASLSWQPMRTAEMIGALKWIATGLGVRVVEQGANIKLPTRRQCKARGIDYTGPASDHARDAWLHLQHYLLKNEIID